MITCDQNIQFDGFKKSATIEDFQQFFLNISKEADLCRLLYEIRQSIWSKILDNSELKCLFQKDLDNIKNQENILKHEVWLKIIRFTQTLD